MSVIDHLKEAFAGESQANRRYLAYAEKADKDGFPQVARLFRAVAAAETVHAHAHLKAMDGIADTVTNLKDAFAGEIYEYEKMYPPFLENAAKEGHKKAERSFQFAMTVEKYHADLYAEALKSVEGGSDLAAAGIHVCGICGHTVMGEAPDNCPVCGAKRERYMEID